MVIKSRLISYFMICISWGAVQKICMQTFTILTPTPLVTNCNTQRHDPQRYVTLKSRTPLQTHTHTSLKNRNIAPCLSISYFDIILRNCGKRIRSMVYICKVTFKNALFTENRAYIKCLLHLR